MAIPVHGIGAKYNMEVAIQDHKLFVALIFRETLTAGANNVLHYKNGNVPVSEEYLHCRLLAGHFLDTHTG